MVTTIKKVKLDARSTIRTLYQVSDGKRKLGYVWSEVGFSYRGSQGWNRGIRYQDFNPIEWKYGLDHKPSSRGNHACSRKSAVDRLIQLVKETRDAK